MRCHASEASYRVPQAARSLALAWPPDPTPAITTLHHHPLCPQSRFIRLVVCEMGLAPDLVEERVFERRRDFLVLNPANQTPVLIDREAGPIAGAVVVAEYLDEAFGPGLGERRLMPRGPAERAEVRRLVEWFNGKFFQEVSAYLVGEKIFKRFMPHDQGGGAPDTDLVRAARQNIRYHLRYIGHLIATRNWLAGDRLTYADLAAGAHLSCVDFLGDVPWGEDAGAKSWYMRLKSRPSFRALLSDRLPGMTPGQDYANLDF